MMKRGSILLNGLWDFSFEQDAWIKRPVPGCFDAEEPCRGLRGKGTYRRTVEGGGPMELECDGLGLRAEFFWDGRKIGSEVTAYAPVTLRFDAGKPGTHELKIICDNTIEETPQSEFRLYYDFYGFGGIFREISLRPLPETYFDSVQIFPDPDTGKVRLQAFFAGPQKKTEVRIDGQACGSLTDSGDGVFPVPQPSLWSPDSPALHELVLDCGDDSFECRFGLRKIEARDGKLFLNGNLLKVAGLNRHDVHPDTGAAVTREQLYHDLSMIKQAGFNMIRGSHYPQSQRMLDLADELGLLVWDEILGWENPVESLTDPEFQRRQKSALTRMIRKSAHHPCILCWGFLNEAITNRPESRECVRMLCRTAKELDPSRPVTFATMFGEKDLCLEEVDIISFNAYPGWYSGSNKFFDGDLVRNRLKELIAFVRNTPALAHKPILISEIGAAALIGDHSGRRWSEDYQADLDECALSFALESPECSGVLLWQFCNSQVDDNNHIMTRPRGYNNKGLVDEYRKPKMAWERVCLALRQAEI